LLPDIENLELDFSTKKLQKAIDAFFTVHFECNFAFLYLAS